MKRTCITFWMAMLGLLAVAPVALAQTSSQDTYSGVLGEQVSAGSGGTPTSTSSLPFTGLQLGLIVLAGAVLLATGLIVRRMTRPNS